MKLKQLPLLSTLLLASGWLTATAAPVEYKIPATEAEFNSMWEVVPGAVDGTWTWVDFTTPYAQTPAVAEKTVGATLILAEPIEMKAGDIYYLQANVTSDAYADDEWFYIVYGTDKNNLTILKEANVFKCWNASGKTEPGFTYKPADTASERTLNVKEDGLYYIGIRSWKGTTSYANPTLKFAGFKIDKDINHPQRATGISVTVGSEGKMEATINWTYPTKNKGGDVISEKLGVNIYRSTSNTKADLYTPSALIATLTDKDAGAKDSYTDITVPEPGKYYYLIAPFSSLGEYSQFESTAYTQSKWIGEDVEVYAPLNSYAVPIKLTAVGDNVEILYTPRADGKNSGWIDPNKLKHKIERSKDNENNYKVIEDAYGGDLPYVDTTLEGPAVYYYRISAIYAGGKASDPVKAGSIFAGGAFDVPFSEDFKTAAGFAKFSVLTSNSSYYWKYNSLGYAETSGYTTYTTQLVTPALNLEAGKTYKVTAKAWVNSSTAAKDLIITGGTEATDVSLTQIEKINITGLSSKKQDIEAYFVPETSGKYYFGFKGENKSSSYYYLDDVLVEESVLKPAAVTDLTFTPDDHGANSATIAFTTPAKTNAGVTMTELTKVEVNRKALPDGEAEIVKTFTGAECAPGTAISFVDEVPEAGKYIYSVVSTLDETTSDEAISEIKWIGYDIPKALSAYSGMNLTSNEDTPNPIIKWGSLSGSVLTENGGYADAANFKYRVYRVNQLGDKESTLIAETDANTHEWVDEAIHDAEWSKYKYAITVVNGPCEGKPVGPNNAVNGGKVALPYEPDLTDDDLIDAFDGSGFIGDNGMVCKLKGEIDENKDFRVYLPPFEAKDANALKHKLTLNLSRHSGEYEEYIHVYYHVISADKAEQKTETAAAYVPGKDNETLLTTEPVRIVSTADEPATETVEFTLPATGKYRVSIKCVSPENKGLTVHNLKLEALDVESGVSEIVAGNGISFCAANGALTLPADAVAAEVFAANGQKVAACGAEASLNIAALPAGLYVVRVATASGELLTAKILK